MLPFIHRLRPKPTSYPKRQVRQKAVRWAGAQLETIHTIPLTGQPGKMREVAKLQELRRSVLPRRSFGMPVFTGDVISSWKL